MIILTLLHFKDQDDLETIKKIFTKEYLNKKLWHFWETEIKTLSEWQGPISVSEIHLVLFLKCIMLMICFNLAVGRIIKVILPKEI